MYNKFMLILGHLYVYMYYYFCSIAIGLLTCFYLFIFQGQLLVVSVSNGPVSNTSAIQLGLTCDDRGVYPAQLLPLLNLDVENQDFIFQQGNMVTVILFIT